MKVFTDNIFSQIAYLFSSSSGHYLLPDVLEAGRVSCPQLSVNCAVSALPELVDSICPDVASNESEHYFPFKD